MNRNIPLALTALTFLSVPLFAGATQTVIPTGAYVPPQQTDTQHVNVTVGGNSINANSNGVNINIPGIGSIKADNNGADINVNADGQSVHVSGNRNGTAVVEVDINAEAAKVATNEELATYTANVQTSNPAITNIQTSPTDLYVDYVQHGKLFGVIPVGMKGKLHSNAQGTVTVNLPWYSAFTTSSVNTLKTNLSKSLESFLGSASNQLNANTQAKVILTVSNEIANQ